MDEGDARVLIEGGVL
jgi:transposase InsO family protein